MAVILDLTAKYWSNYLKDMHFVSLNINNPISYKYNSFGVTNFNLRKIGFVCVIRDEQMINLIARLWRIIRDFIWISWASPQILNDNLDKKKTRDYTV